MPTVRCISAHTLSAWRNGLQGYSPNVAGNFTYSRGGLANRLAAARLGPPKETRDA